MPKDGYAGAAPGPDDRHASRGGLRTPVRAQHRMCRAARWRTVALHVASSAARGEPPTWGTPTWDARTPSVTDGSTGGSSRSRTPRDGKPDALFARLGLDDLVALERQHIPDECPVLFVVSDGKSCAVWPWMSRCRSRNWPAGSGSIGRPSGGACGRPPSDRTSARRAAARCWRRMRNICRWSRAPALTEIISTPCLR